MSPVELREARSPPKVVVLIVEDEPIMRMAAVDMVEDAGFEVIEAADATQAVEILQRRLDVRIVFTDIDMPRGMDGIRLAAIIRERWPPIEIIITSGYHDEPDITLPARSVFIPKPYAPEKVIGEMWRMAAETGQTS